MKSHEIDYKIIGDDMQMVEIELDKHESVIAEAGAMNYMEDGITYEAKMGDGSNPSEGFLSKLVSAGKRAITGESIMMTHFKNLAPDKKHVSFAAPYPGKIIPVDLSKVGGSLFCQKDAFLCAAYGTKLDIAFTKRIGAGLFGGEGFILEKLEGDGKAFLHAGGTVIKKQLNDEVLKVDTGCVVCFTKNIDYNIEMVRGLKSMFFGGEGMFLCTLQGKGIVMLQSLPLSRLADRILRYAPAAGGRRKGEGSILGSLGDFLNGD
jgi:uncharacterized protein (TIGR00266 family)